MLFPPAPTCQSCLQPITGFFRADFCVSCLNKLVFSSPPFCRRCGRPLATAGSLCYTCAHSVQYFQLNRSTAVYTEEMRALIQRFKYGGQISLGQALGRLMAQRMECFPELKKPKVVIPIPLHPETAATRSFNQALILAKEVADKIHRPVSVDVLQRLPGSALQHTLSRRQRKQGLSGEFYVANPSQINGQRVLVVDDVLTTGNTLSQAARVLRRAGAKEVTGYTLAVGISAKDGF